MRSGKRGDVCDQLLKKLVRVYKHYEVTSRNRHEFLPWSLNRSEILSGKLRRCGEIFRSLEEKDRNCEFESEILHRCGSRLGKENFSTEKLAIKKIVQISHRITRSV